MSKHCFSFADMSFGQLTIIMIRSVLLKIRIRLGNMIRCNFATSRHGYGFVIVLASMVWSVLPYYHIIVTFCGITVFDFGGWTVENWLFRLLSNSIVIGFWYPIRSTYFNILKYNVKGKTKVDMIYTYIHLG